MGARSRPRGPKECSKVPKRGPRALQDGRGGRRSRAAQERPKSRSQEGQARPGKPRRGSGAPKRALEPQEHHGDQAGRERTRGDKTREDRTRRQKEPTKKLPKRSSRASSRSDVQRTCPTDCSSRSATVARSIKNHPSAPCFWGGPPGGGGQTQSLTIEHNHYCMSFTQSKKTIPMSKAKTTTTAAQPNHEAPNHLVSAASTTTTGTMKSPTRTRPHHHHQQRRQPTHATPERSGQRLRRDLV